MVYDLLIVKRRALEEIEIVQIIKTWRDYFLDSCHVNRYTDTNVRLFKKYVEGDIR